MTLEQLEAEHIRRVLATTPTLEEAATLLVDRRRSRNGPPSEALTRWRSTCDILELTLNAPAG